VVRHHVLFTQVGELHFGPAHLLVPRLASAAPRMIALAAVGALLLMRMHWSIHRVIAVAAGLSLLLDLVLRMR